MSTPVITGIAPRWESALATLLGASGRAHLVRRCADIAELVGVARAGHARVALVSSDLRGLDRDVLTALQEAGVGIIGVHPPGDEDGARTLRRWGAAEVVAADTSAPELDLALTVVDEGGGSLRSADRRIDGQVDHGSVDAARATDATSASDAAGGAGRVPSGSAEDPDAENPDVENPDVDDVPGVEGVGSTEAPVDTRGGAGADLRDDRSTVPEPAPGPTARGEVVVVWGAYGSPGRTTVAVNLAAELAGPLEPVILVDADTYAASVAQWLAVLDESPGVAAAARAADQGALDGQRLRRLAPEVRPGLAVLTGLPRADRWPELREASLADVLEQCRQLARWVVVDVAPVVEQDEELSFDTHAPRRNGATLTALEAADRVVVVGTGDPVGLHRLVRCLDALPALSAGLREVVVTRVRPGPVGPEPERRIRESLTRFAGVETVHLLSDDPESLDAALLHGRLLLEIRPSSPVVDGIRRLAAVVRGQQVRHRRQRRSWRAALQRRG